MARVYRVSEGGKTIAMSQVRCRDEEKELQLLLSGNFDLLPGDQINPEDPRRWMLIRREMPVEDPATGGARWSIDFFLVDQDGTPTFVECKRFADTRSRREVVGQMMEYAANGQYYWNATHLYEQAERDGVDLEAELNGLRPNDAETVDELLEVVENNLREGQVRLVFFLEEAPFELRSIVEFLNRQMERTEVLIVEARQYELDGHRVVSPQLFGYTEAARRIKKTTQLISSPRRQWDEESFFDAVNKLDHRAASAIRSLYDEVVRQPAFDIRWGSGKRSGTANVYAPALSPKSIISIASTGRLWFNFGWLDTSDQVLELRDELFDFVRKEFSPKLADEDKDRHLSLTKWFDRVDALKSALIASLPVPEGTSDLGPEGDPGR